MAIALVPTGAGSEWVTPCPWEEREMVENKIITGLKEALAHAKDTPPRAPHKAAVAAYHFMRMMYFGDAAETFLGSPAKVWDRLNDRQQSEMRDVVAEIEAAPEEEMSNEDV